MISTRTVHLGYYLGITVLLVGQALFLVTFVCPFWVRYNGYSRGLWLNCSRRGCRTISTISALFEGWWWAVQCLQCVSLVCYLAASCHTLLAVRAALPRLLHNARHRRCLLTSAALAGLTGFVGDTVLLGKLHTSHTPYSGVSWAFVVNLIGCISAGVASIVIVVVSSLQARLADEEGSAATADETQEEGGVEEGSTRPTPFHIVVQEMASRSVWSHDQISTSL